MASVDSNILKADSTILKADNSTVRYLIGAGNRNWNDPNNWSLTSGGSPSFGSNIAVNGDFSSWNADNPNNWILNGTENASNYITESSGSCRLVSNGSAMGIYQSILTVGKTYRVTIDVKSITGVIYIRLGSGTIYYISTTGIKIAYLDCITTSNLSILRSGACDAVFDNIIVEECLSFPDETTDCIFDANSGTGTITVNGIANMLDFTCSNIGALTLANSAYAFNVYGNISDSINRLAGFTGTGYLYFKSTNLGNILTSNGNTVGWNRIYYDCIGSNSFSELVIPPSRRIRFTAATTQTIAKATIGANVIMDCTTASTYNLALGEIVTAENINIKGCVVTQDSKFFAEANSVDSGSNSKVVFGDYFTPQEILIE